MDDNYFDPSPSPNLPEDDPLRQWMAQVQSDPQLGGLLATDPQGAMNRMRELGIPPPPQGFTAYADGMDASNGIPGIRRSTMPGTYGGAEPAPPANTIPPGTDPMSAGSPPPSIAERAKSAITGMFPTFGPNGKLWGNLTSDQGTPPAYSGGGIGSDSARTPNQSAPSNLFAGADLDPEDNPSAGQPLVPRPRPAEAGARATDMSSQAKKLEGLGEFGKSLQGIKPVAPVPPQKISSPNAPSPVAIQTPSLNNILGLIGQGASPISMTLGRLLATGKA